jgi:hypothetical protein
MDLSKDANWNASDMGKRLSRLTIKNPANGEYLTRGLLLAGFPSAVLEEYAKKKNIETTLATITKFREEEYHHVLNLLLFMPWLAMLAFIGLPVFIKAFHSWDLATKSLFILSWLLIYGVIPIKTFVEVLKRR